MSTTEQPPDEPAPAPTETAPDDNDDRNAHPGELDEADPEQQPEPGDADAA